MGKQELTEMFENYCKTFGLTIGGPTYTEGGENGKYICPAPGTFNLLQSDPRLGKKYAIVKYGENGTMALCYDYVTADHIYGVMQGMVLCKKFGTHLNTTSV